MKTELFLAYAEDYIQEAAEVGAKNLLFYDKLLRKKELSVKQLLDAYWQPFMKRPKVAVVYDDGADMTVEINGEKHYGYSYEQPWSDFIDLLESGEKLIFCDGFSKLNKTKRALARRWALSLVREADKYGAGVHLMNIQGLRPMLDFQIASADVRFRIFADMKNVYLPNGVRVLSQDVPANKHRSWFNAFGVNPYDVLTWSDYIVANIKSFEYAMANIKNNPGFEMPKREVDSPEVGESSLAALRTGTNKMEKAHEEVAKRREGMVCDQCTVKRCASRFPGAVCSKENSAFLSLASHFESRDVNVILAGLQFVLSEQSERFMKARAVEEPQSDEEQFMLDKEVTALGSTIMKDGMALVKLMKPELAGNPMYAVFMNNPNVMAFMMQQGGGEIGAGARPALSNQGRAKEIPAKVIESQEVVGG